LISSFRAVVLAAGRQGIFCVPTAVKSYLGFYGHFVKNAASLSQVVFYAQLAGGKRLISMASALFFASREQYAMLSMS
jgi:hypothetical protein